MNNMKIKLLPCAIALLLGGVYSASASAHGYIIKPTSRAAALYNNDWRANAVEAPKRPLGGLSPEQDTQFENSFEFPPDGKLANGDSDQNGIGAGELNNEQHKWVVNPMKPGKQQFEWSLSAPHSTTYFTYYITKQDWKSKPGYGKILTREMFEDQPFCHDIWANGRPSPGRTVIHTCDVPERTGEQKIYAVWRVRNTANAFYQMIDVDFGNGGDDVIQAPVANIHADGDTLSLTPLMLDGGGSSGGKISYHWEVLSNHDKVTLDGATGSKASIRLQAAAVSDFTVNVRLTVSNSKGSNSKNITLKAQKSTDINLPVAVAGKDFTVKSSSASAGYLLDGSASKNADSYQWTIVKGAGDFWLQEKSGSPWVSAVNHVQARALIPANKIGQATYRLTVSKNGKTAYDDITVTVIKDGVPPEPDAKAWDKTATYAAACTKVTYNGSTWLNGWWSRGNQPGADGVDGVWRKAGAANMHAACK
ncbi:TPA: lytic polysaccharide monooxygenase [Serratia odorifera]